MKLTSGISTINNSPWLSALAKLMSVPLLENSPELQKAKQFYENSMIFAESVKTLREFSPREYGRPVVAEIRKSRAIKNAGRLRRFKEFHRRQKYSPDLFSVEKNPVRENK